MKIISRFKFVLLFLMGILFFSGCSSTGYMYNIREDNTAVISTLNKETVCNPSCLWTLFLYYIDCQNHISESTWLRHI